MNPIRALEDSPVVIVAERDTSEARYDASAAADLALDGLFELAHETLDPLTVELHLACCDSATGVVVDEPPNPYRQLELQDLPASIESRPARVSGFQTVPALDPATIQHWLSEQMLFECEFSDSRPGWREIAFNAVRARLPKDLIKPGHDSITLVANRGAMQYPVSSDDRGHWAAGPLETDPNTTPLHLSVAQESGLLTIFLTIGWSLWTGADEVSASARFQESLNRLAAKGWSVRS